jgi:hypothetical protein
MAKTGEERDDSHRARRGRGRSMRRRRMVERSVVFKLCCTVTNI